MRFALLGDGEEEVIGARFLLIDEDIYVHMYRQVSLFSLSAVVRLQKEIGLAEYGEARRPAGTGKQELACSRSLLACGRFVGIDCRTNRCPLSCCKFLSGLQHSDRMDLDAIVGDVLEEPRTITKVRSRSVSNSLLANYALRNACHPSLLLFSPTSSS